MMRCWCVVYRVKGDCFFNRFRCSASSKRAAIKECMDCMGRNIEVREAYTED